MSHTVGPEGSEGPERQSGPVPPPSPFAYPPQSTGPDAPASWGPGSASSPSDPVGPPSQAYPPYGEAPPAPAYGQAPPAYGQVPQPGQAYPPYGAPPPPPGSLGRPYGATSGRATAVLVLGIAAIPTLGLCGLGFVAAIVALVLAPGANREIRDSGGALTGEGQVKAGRILAIIALALAVLVGVFFVVAAVAGAGPSGHGYPPTGYN